MPYQICHGRRRTSRRKGVQDGERRLKPHDQDGTVLVPMKILASCWFEGADTHPTAYVLQSHAGAIAVIGSLIVRADMCSEFWGWNRMMLPSALPVTCRSVPERLPANDTCLTKGDVSVSHPCCGTNCMV